MSVHETKAKFSAVLKEVAAGETVVVTNHDNPVAEIRPISEERPVVVLGAFKGQLVYDEETFEWTDEELNELFGNDICPLPKTE